MMDYEYSETVHENIQKQAAQWEKAFESSPDFMRLKKRQKRDALLIISLIPDFMYSYYLRKPREWTASALEEILLYLFPRKLVVGEEFYENVEPVLSAYFSFLQEIGVINNSHALINRLKKVTPLMITFAQDSNNWGFGKQLAVSEEELKREFSDERAPQDDMTIVNRENNEFFQKSPVHAGGRTPLFNHLCRCGSGKNFNDCHGGSVMEFKN